MMIVVTEISILASRLGRAVMAHPSETRDLSLDPGLEQI